MNKFYMVRHGETDLNVAQVFYGHTDCGLTEKGVEQAMTVGKALSEIRFDQVYISPLKRAMYTAELILELNKHKSTIISEPKLMEIGFGQWENMLMSDIMKQFPEAWETYYAGWPEVPPPQGESFRIFFNRVSVFFEELKLKETQQKTCEDRHILIVAHHGPLALLPVFALNLELQDYWKFRIEQGVYSILTEDRGTFVLEKINTAKKLPPLHTRVD